MGIPRDRCQRIAYLDGEDRRDFQLTIDPFHVPFVNFFITWFEADFLDVCPAMVVRRTTMVSFNFSLIHLK